MADDAIPAASLILLRERAPGPPDILVIRRSARLRFAGGAYVFPGGRVDAADRLADDTGDAAARRAALRETREETGIHLTLPPADLIPFARWRPEIAVPRRFDTRFFLARADGDQQPTADGTETDHAFWASAAAVLDRCARGDGHAIFPTRRLLERIARFGSFAEARADALLRAPVTITPRVEQRDDGEWLVIPTDQGYPVTEERLSDALRG